jgi:hypothetical protein
MVDGENIREWICPLLLDLDEGICRVMGWDLGDVQKASEIPTPEPKMV